MHLRRQSLFILIVAAVVAGAPGVFAWGPITHMTVNEAAYDRVAAELGPEFAFTGEQRDEFIGGGPCPDLKFAFGASFPIVFHNEPEVGLRLVGVAKNWSEAGLGDVAMALGWAGHIYGEVWTAHAEDGYPSHKLTFTIPKNGGVNHQVNELVCDLLNFRARQRAQAGIGLAVPAQVLAKAMAEEAARDSSLPKPLTPNEIRKGSISFLKTVEGIKVLADYLLRERPDLLEEMDEFHADRQDQFDGSVAKVSELLRENARGNLGKKRSGTLDFQDGFFRLGSEQSIGEQARSMVMQVMARAAHSDSGGDIFTRIGYGVVKTSLKTPLLKDRFMEIAKSIGTKSIWGDDRASRCLSRFVEAMLLRGDLSYPEIIAYAQEGLELDPASVDKQKAQFALAGLTPTGRKPVIGAQVFAALAEVERVEKVNDTWPWFWPWRPGPVGAAEAREKAGRLLAFFFEDHPEYGVSPAKVKQLYEGSKDLRTRNWKYSSLSSVFNPIAKYNARKDVGTASEAFAKQEKLFAGLFQTLVSGRKPSDLLADAVRRRGQTAAALTNAQAQLKGLPAWNLIARDRKKDEIRKLEKSLEELDTQIESLQSLTAGGTAAAPTGVRPTTGAVDAAVEVPEGLTLERARSDFENAYVEYSTVMRKGTQTAIQQAGEKVRRARAIYQNVRSRLVDKLRSLR